MLKKWIPIAFTLFIGLASLLSLYPDQIRAHAEYERSEPPADAVIPEPPAEVHVWFTQELFRREGANTLAVFGPDGTQVDNGDSQIDDDDRKHMFVSLQNELPDGLYTVKYATLSIDDGDDFSGEFSFTVGPGTSEETSESAAPQPQASPTLSPTPLPSPTPAPQTGGSLPCLSGLLAGAVALGVVIARRRGYP